MPWHGCSDVDMRSCLNTVTKLGESTFAEVFNGIYNDCRVAMKIVPFGGPVMVNGCNQTSMDDGTTKGDLRTHKCAC